MRPSRSLSSSSFDRLSIFIFFLSLLNFARWLQQHSLQGPSSLTTAQESSVTSRDRILYIITSIREFDDGERATVKGYDRFSKTILPLIVESTTSMIATGYRVDLYFISHYPFTDARRAELRAALPESIGLQIWDDATPIGYARDLSETDIQPVTRALARQHRHVIKDKLLHYDVFVSFEDDMLIKGPHVEHFCNVTNELYQLRRDAADTLGPGVTANSAHDVFYGEMTKSQLERMLPGFIRVEVAIDKTFVPPPGNAFAQIPVDFDWNTTRRNLHVDPSICCHVSAATANDQLPMAPSRDKTYFWETSIDALGVRKLPERAAWDWVIRQAGNRGIFTNPKFVIGDYWSGRDHKYFGNLPRPKLHEGRYSNNQGGWMGTRRQIIEWHTRQCSGGFLPPYDNPEFPDDGLDRISVEFWSGGIHIFGPRGCTMQRILVLDPEGFSKHLLYHTSNNKQRAMLSKFAGRSVDEVWGQLNTVRKSADERMRQELAAGRN